MTVHTKEIGQVILEGKGLRKDYGGVRAVNEVDLVVHDGELLGLIGPNGSGKTTLFNVITGMTRASGGQLVLNGIDISGLRADQRTVAGLGRTFQNIRIFASLDALTNVMIGGHKHLQGGFWPAVFSTPGARRREANCRKTAQELLELVGLAGKEKVLGGNFSCGEQKRLEIARALATSPVILLLDEPAAGMNSAEDQVLVELLRQLNQQGLTIFIVEHNMDVVMSICDRIIVLNAGEKLVEGTPAQIQVDPRVIEVYLGKEAVEVGV